MGWVAVQTTRSMDTDMGVGTVAYSEHGRSLHGEARAAVGVLGFRGGENGAAPAMVLRPMGSPYSAWPTSGGEPTRMLRTDSWLKLQGNARGRAMMRC